MNGGGFRTADYAFDLPPERIAQHPAARRDESRMMVVERESGNISHAVFRDLPALIPAGDTIVFNTTRVLKARLFGKRETGGKTELLLLEPRSDGYWNALVRPGAKIRNGGTIRIADDVSVIVHAGTSGVARVVEFVSPLNVDAILEAYGHIPLPPYIDRADTDVDAERYQTVYSRQPGSVAAPTAGLHFTPALMDALTARGVARADVVLHVGTGTFRPVENDDPSAHSMHVERFALDAGAAGALNTTRRRAANIWAVGTTSLRVLESVVDSEGRFAARSGTTDIFIRPPHVVRGADRLITNFHLPRSTLLMLVAAFAGYELTRHAYEVAIAEGYRFYSYGDAMCVI